MQQEKTMEYKEPIDQVLENTIEYQDDNGNTVILQKDIIRRAYAPSDITEKEWQEFIFIVEKQRLDPTLYEVYCAKIQGKMTPLVSYRTYLKRSLASGKLVKHPNVKLVKPDEKNKDTWVAIFTTKREGMDDDFVWEVPYIEAGYTLTRDGRKPRGGMWNVQPGFQLKVRAFVQGLRIVCADVVGGLPHVVEEIQSEDSEETIKLKTQSLQSGNDEQSNDEPAKEKAEGEAEERALYERSDQSKSKALNGFQAKINSFDNVKALEIWAKNQKIIEKHPFKDDILSMIDSRKSALTSNEVDQVKDVVSGEIIRSSTINQIMVLTGKSFSDVNSYVSDNMLTSGLISAVLSGEKGAIEEFSEGLASFLAIQNEEADLEMDIPE